MCLLLSATAHEVSFDLFDKCFCCMCAKYACMRVRAMARAWMTCISMHMQSFDFLWVLSWQLSLSRSFLHHGSGSVPYTTFSFPPKHKSLLQALLYRKAWPFFMLWVLLLKGGLLADAGGCRNRRRRQRPWNFNICHVNTRQECVVPAPQNKSRNPGLSLPPAAAACQVLFELLSLAIICKKKTKFSPSPDLPAGTIFLSM